MRNRRRRQAKRDANSSPMTSSSYLPAIPPSVSHGNSFGINRVNAGVSNMMKSSKFTPDGIAFLKCAFAPPDFSVNRIQGVPDSFEGNSLVKKHRLITPTTFSNNRDYYIWLAPIPGVSYLIADVAAGSPIVETTQFEPVYYSDYDSMFGSNTDGTDSSNIVTKYRFVSNHIELVPTVNQMQWSGSIQAFKIPTTLQVRQGHVVGAGTNEIYAITGLQACNSTNSSQYSGPFFNGVYTGCYSQNCEFNFQPIIEGLGPRTPRNVEAAYDFGQIDGRIPGMDNEFESMIVKISGITTNQDAALIKTWACVEYQVQPGNSLYEFQTASPVDPVALAAYRKIISELPVGVSFIDNESFWRRVLQIIKNISGGLSVIPGPYGAVAGGVNLITTGINDLL